ncbi:MAG: guanylate kinase [Pseudoflavonifractor sp.]|nr:guanylate kinase [Pseudoflavonifractor sp.]
MATEGKIIIISAPSGCGKSTIIGRLLELGEIDMRFSVSATSRAPRAGEVDGVHYRFLTEECFRQCIERGEFVEYEEVYPGRFYGTLKSEIERVCGDGHNVILDIDVKGGVNVKRIYGDRAVSIFIMPPSVDELRRRLVGRATDAPEVIEERVAKAAYEITFAPQFDHTVVNEDLDTAVMETDTIIKDFVGA